MFLSYLGAHEREIRVTETCSKLCKGIFFPFLEQNKAQPSAGLCLAGLRRPKLGSPAQAVLEQEKSLGSRL